MNLFDEDTRLHDLLAVQKGVELFLRELSEEFGVRLLAAGDWTPLKEFSCPYRFGVTCLDEEGELNLPYSHGGFPCRHLRILPLLPVAGLDDLRAGREAVHDIHPAGIRAAIGERRLNELAVVEPGVAFEAVHAPPVLERDFDEFGVNCRIPSLFEGGEAPARVVECPHDCAGGDVHSIRAEAVVAFSGHECSVDDEFDSFHFELLFSLKKILREMKLFGIWWKFAPTEQMRL